jgi:hypothetical protein
LAPILAALGTILACWVEDPTPDPAEELARLVPGHRPLLARTSLPLPPAPFDPAAPEAHVGPRCERSVEGQPISQWRITVGDVAQFLDRRRHGPVEDEQPMPPTSQPCQDRGRRARR